MERIKAEAGSQNWREHRERLLGTTKKLDLSAKFKLPILPGAVQEFSRTSEIPDISNDVLARILESDSGLTVELLSLVNSSVFGLRSKASSVKQALNLLGLHRAKTFILTTAVKRAMSKSSSKLINLNLFWANNLERALFAREVALLLKADPEIAYSAAMLQDFLLPVLTTALFEQYTDYVDQQQRTPQLLCSYEQKRFGWDHATAAAQVALQWGFPDELICCLYLHHQGLALAAGSRLRHNFRSRGGPVVAASGCAVAERSGVGPVDRTTVPLAPLRSSLAGRTHRTAIQGNGGRPGPLPDSQATSGKEVGFFGHNWKPLTTGNAEPWNPEPRQPSGKNSSNSILPGKPFPCCLPR